MFSFDRRPPRQRAAREALGPALMAAGLAYVVLDLLLSRLLGGVWGVFASLLLVGIPLGALWWAGETGGGPRQAWRGGVWLALAVLCVYAWVFVGMGR
ncbi:MAG: hypothetical protein Q8K82_04580 [Gemmatimonadaceae bacterium]|nr:hypothetical protein [Gemmatimonadaceae bacterium]